MTETIVALDGPRPSWLLDEIRAVAGAPWVKVGPAAMTSPGWPGLVRAANCNVFVDLKLADTADAVRLAVRRLACAGVAAVSTSTDEATEAALEAAVGYPLLVWRLLCLTDTCDFVSSHPLRDSVGIADGVIAPLCFLSQMRQWFPNKPIICPGIRLSESDDFGGHIYQATVAQAARAGVDFIVMGRPFWQSPNPGAVYRAVQAEIARS